MSDKDKISVEAAARSHFELANEWEDLLRMVRSIPGFEDFLQPSSYATLQRYLPPSGSVVVINVTEERCDAIALTADSNDPLHIPLPNFTLEKAHELRRELQSTLEASGVRMREAGQEFPGRALGRFKPKMVSNKILAVLQTLWTEVVRPIPAGLRYLTCGSPEHHMPRIWWCPTGPLSFLPIHCAGVYGIADCESVLDYAISSYIPTVATLIDRVKNDRQIDEGVHGLFLTSQPRVLGAAAIPGTTKEVGSIYAKATGVGVRALKLEGDEVSIVGCLESMEQYGSVHLACHASQNAAERLQSEFLFHSGSLSLGTVVQRNLKNADLAFLSACQTSAGEEKLSDEAVHLAAGMLAAGYRRVVATMWSISDAYAPDVASDFYEYLLSRREEVQEKGGYRFDGGLSAYALHYAIQALRGRLGHSDESLLAWIPYVHFGY
ncbi:hypothetical protein FA13DRAFT_244578 [Coprinellus micaceus]|uniref:CHAT domain-containing protein n=1 Tax=Coprinellus micaceus TaxID=71717 RepID=A0A4Y7SF06_COPMI|nr:hypothetical protein FA13DRAFT_244578 [Coprinellus micaceus]